MSKQQTITIVLVVLIFVVMIGWCVWFPWSQWGWMVGLPTTLVIGSGFGAIAWNAWRA